MKLRTAASIALSFALTEVSAHASFHLFDIQEVYSNADGSVQFIELFTASNSQQVVGGQSIRLEVASPVSTLDTFTFSGNGPSPTANKTYLIGTANLSTLYAVTPDFVLPANFLTVSGGFANKRLNFANGTDIVNLSSLPLNGVMSLNAVIGDNAATAFSINAQATPTNFAGQTATIPEAGTVGLLMCGGLAFGGLWSRRRGRVAKSANS